MYHYFLSTLLSKGLRNVQTPPCHTDWLIVTLGHSRDHWVSGVASTWAVSQRFRLADTKGMKATCLKSIMHYTEGLQRNKTHKLAYLQQQLASIKSNHFEECGCNWTGSELPLDLQQINSSQKGHRVPVLLVQNKLTVHFEEMFTSRKLPWPYFNFT